MDPPKINFLNGLILGASFLDISRYLIDKYFDIVCRYHHQETLNNILKINFLKGSSYDVSFFDISSCLRDKYFDIAPTA